VVPCCRWRNRLEPLPLWLQDRMVTITIAITTIILTTVILTTIATTIMGEGTTGEF
jgi:hypothetical protein